VPRRRRTGQFIEPLPFIVTLQRDIGEIAVLVGEIQHRTLLLTDYSAAFT
jgi:hypothetical protein